MPVIYIVSSAIDDFNTYTRDESIIDAIVKSASNDLIKESSNADNFNINYNYHITFCNKMKKNSQKSSLENVIVTCILLQT